MRIRRARSIRRYCLAGLFGLAMLLTGCMGKTVEQTQAAESDPKMQAGSDFNAPGLVSPAAEIVSLEDGFSAVRYDGDYGFDGFLAQGGASHDADVVKYLANNLLSDMPLGGLLSGAFGCSTLAVQSPEGDALFGRNFDWNACEAMVVAAYPEHGYASLSTVNMDFITQSAGSLAGAAMRADAVKTLAALYAPLDGMNEAGLAVSVNMIQDRAAICQDTEKPDITTTTAVRLLLDQAGSTEQAVELLRQYDLHGSMGMMVHFAIADAGGHSVAVEYINNVMAVTETPVLTNFYLAEGERQGIGTAQSHERYDILLNALRETPQMRMEDVRDALDSVSKKNFGEFESTEWSVVMNLSAGEARYYHRENYERAYIFHIESGSGEGKR